MAALQTLRNKPALLMSIIGGALLLFIVTLVWEGNPFGAPNVEAEVNGKELTYEDYRSQIENEESILALLLGGTTDQQKKQIEAQVWERFVTNTVIADEAEALGLSVTEEDVRNALSNVSPQQLQQLAYALQSGQANLLQVPAAQKIMIFVAQSGFPTTMEGYKQFLTTIDQQMKQAQSNPEAAERLAQMKAACLYMESQIAGELMQQKYFTLIQYGTQGNPVSGKMDYAEATMTYDVDMAMVPYSMVDDKDIKITDEDLKAKYEEVKELYRVGQPSRDLKMINVKINPSVKDNDKLFAQLNTIADSLKSAKTADEVVKVMKSGRSEITYNNVYLPKSAFEEGRLYDIAAALDSMAVGTVVLPTMSPRDENGLQHITTYKLVGQKATPDSVQYCMVAAESKALADSVIAAANGGKTLAQIAKEFGKRLLAPEQLKGDTLWQATPYYVDAKPAQDSTATTYTDLCQIPVGEVGCFSQVDPQSGRTIYWVAKVLQTKASTMKYNVAIAKYPVKFSTETFNDAARKLNDFLAKSKTIADIEKNAAKSGYTITELPNFTTTDAMNQRINIGGEDTKNAFMWAFDKAEAGQVSQIYKCGDNTDQLIVLAVENINDDDYRAWNLPSVKTQLEMLVSQDKKAEKILAQVKNVKTFEQAKGVKGVLTQNMPGTNVFSLDPALAGAIERVQKGFTGTVKTMSGIAMAQVNGSKNATEQKFDFAAMAPQLAQMRMNSILGRGGNILETLVKKADINDQRYKF